MQRRRAGRHQILNKWLKRPADDRRRAIIATARFEIQETWSGLPRVNIRLARRKRRDAHGPLTAPVLLVIAVTLVAAVYVAYVLWPRWPDAPASLDAPALPVVVAGTVFNIEPAAIRNSVQRRPGTQDASTSPICGRR